MHAIVDAHDIDFAAIRDFVLQSVEFTAKRILTMNTEIQCFRRSFRPFGKRNKVINKGDLDLVLRWIVGQCYRMKKRIQIPDPQDTKTFDYDALLKRSESPDLSVEIMHCRERGLVQNCHRAPA